ncbi:MAG: two-component sensor histidine kinase, partial [Selenomonas artemidis]
MKTHSIGYQKRLLIYLMLGGLLPLLLASAMILYTADSVYDNIRAKSGRTEAQRISGEIDNLVGSYERLMNPLLVRRETVD